MNTTLAVIDIGSNSIRMVLGQLLPDGKAQVLERFRKAVRLGQDTFTKGKLGKEAIRTVVSILREYQKTLKLYNVEHIRIVATSAVREAGNAEILIDRVLTATGLEIEIIDVSEESRLTVLAVQSSLGNSTGKISKNSLITEVGGGHTTLTVLAKGEIVVSNSLYFGSIRLREALSSGTSADSKLIRNELLRFLPSIESFMPLEKIQAFFALGADARFAAQEAGKSVKGSELSTISKAKFYKLVDKIKSRTPEELSDLYNIEFTDAETLNVALLVYQELLNYTKAEELTVSSSSMREELLQDLARRITGKEDKTFAHGVIHSATAIAEKYKVDIEHSNRVREVSVKLFDTLQNEHGLKFRHRVLLEAAALLHEVGTFISPRGYHKHSYYLIKNSEIFGLNQTEVALVANIARYHRRAQPKTSHLEYMSLSREQRIIVNKLASLLRIAEALDAGHNTNSVNMKCTVEKNNLILSIPGMKDLVMKKRILPAESDMFEDIYGLNTKLEEI
ncbi:MAG: Ppx/GppA family phosphatase [Sedimentisphaerales bacterium]|nr:Ppx/GppA family phosphatase [Sedimentisphaerales bacterium]